MMGLLDSQSTESEVIEGENSGFEAAERTMHQPSSGKGDFQSFFVARYSTRSLKFVKIVCLVTIISLLFVCLLLHLQKKPAAAKDTSESAEHTESRLLELEKTLNKTVLDHDTIKHHININRKYRGWYLASNDYFYRLFHHLVKYRIARKNCKSQGARLASFGLRNETVRRELVQNLMRPADQDVYIGLDDLRESHHYVWSDGVPSTNANTQWAAGEPNKDGGVERCGEAAKVLGWFINDIRCNVVKFYLCEVKHDHNKRT